VYLGINNISIPEQLMNTALLIKEKSGYSLFVVHSTQYTDKTVICQKNYADRVNEEVSQS
jgi:hypothetical protein